MQRQSGLKYYAYKKLNGIQKSKCFESYESAKTWKMSAKFFDEPESGGLTLFKDVRDRYFEYKKSKLQPTTWETYKSKAKHLKFFDELPMNQITSKAIDLWLVQIKRPEYLELLHKTRTSFRHELSALRQILVYFNEYMDDSFQMPIKKRHLDDSIVNYLKYKESKQDCKTKYIPRHDYQRWLNLLFAKAGKNPRLMVYAALAFFQSHTGCRIGEACALEWKDIDLNEGFVSIYKTVQWARGKGREDRISALTKTSEGRTVPLVEPLIKVLTDWKRIDCRAHGLVFCLRGLGPMSYRSIQYYYNKGFDELGIKASSTHILRHSFATDFQEKTLNQLALAKVLGHKHLKQTEHYAKITNKTMQTGIEAYNKSLSITPVTDISSIIEAKKIAQDG
jgi:integrase